VTRKESLAEAFTEGQDLSSVNRKARSRSARRRAVALAVDDYWIKRGVSAGSGHMQAMAHKRAKGSLLEGLSLDVFSAVNYR